MKLPEYEGAKEGIAWPKSFKESKIVMGYQTEVPAWATEAGGLGFIKVHPDEPGFPAETHSFRNDEEGQDAEGYHLELIGLDCDDPIRFENVLEWSTHPIIRPEDMPY